MVISEGSLNRFPSGVLFDGETPRGRWPAHGKTSDPCRSQTRGTRLKAQAEKGAKHSSSAHGQSSLVILMPKSQSSIWGSYVTSRGQKSNLLFRSSFDMKLRLPGGFFDALNRSAIDFYLVVQSGVKFSKIQISNQNDPKLGSFRARPPSTRPQLGLKTRWLPAKSYRNMDHWRELQNRAIQGRTSAS